MTADSQFELSAAQQKYAAALSAIVCARDGFERQRPDGIDDATWRQAVADGKQFVRQWIEKAAELGWTPADIFGLPDLPERPAENYRRLSRVDGLGLVLCLRGRPVTDLTVSKAAIATSSGGHLSFYRGPAS